ncbi:MAG: YdiU family protein [Limnobacter sp.]|nr:YdiU family protein [Limnobacter sp.]
MLLSPNALLVKEYASLGQPFVYAVPCTPLKSEPRLIQFNEELAEQIGLQVDDLCTNQGIAILTGQQTWPGYDSIASIYCGHQFGVFVPQLGDGRAIVITEIRKGADYKQLQLKGAGPTPFSRRADGRAVLRSSIREFVASEALHALGIPTTRALSLTATPDPVFRETTEMAAVVCRVSESFLRFGHVEYFSHTNQHQELLQLLDWHIERHHSELYADDFENNPAPTLINWLKWLTQATAKLMAQWQSVGFCHGVMNTDNMSLMGLTIDYGPYGFLDKFDVDHICNHSDTHGRYSYRNQPRIGHWNLYVLASALMPLLHNDRETLQTILDEYPQQFQREHNALFAAKMGLNKQVSEEKQNEFIEYTLQMLHEHKLDMTRFFRSLSALQAPHADHSNLDKQFALWQKSSTFPWVLGDESQVESARAWLGQWMVIADNNLIGEKLNQINPIAIARNHLLQEAIAACEKGDDHVLKRLLQAVCKPYLEQPDLMDLYQAAPEWAQHLEISCSS